MATAKEQALAERVYARLCNYLDEKELKYKKDDKTEMGVQLTVGSDGVPICYIIRIDVERQLIRVLAHMPFQMSEENRLAGAIAYCAASDRISVGCFDYGYESGYGAFRLVTSFRESLVGDGLFADLLGFSVSTVGRYAAKFLAISKGVMSIGDFLKGEYLKDE